MFVDAKDSIYLHRSKSCSLRVWLPSSLNIATEILPLRTQAGLDISSTTGNYEQYNRLDKHKDLRDDKELGQGWMTSFFSYNTVLLITVTLLYTVSSGLNYFLTGNLYLLTTFIYFIYHIFCMQVIIANQSTCLKSLFLPCKTDLHTSVEILPGKK